MGTGSFRVRRIVVGRNQDGAPAVLSDGAPSLTIDAPTGFGVSELLSSTGPLTSADSGGDPPREAVGAFPANGGVAARLIRFPATNEWVRIAGDDPERPGMHRSETLDLMVVLSGHIVLGVEDGEDEVGPGDAVIQRGTLHRWRVTGDAPCTYLSVLLAPLGGEPEPSVPLPELAAGRGPKLFVTGIGPQGSTISVAGTSRPDEYGRRRWWDTDGPVRSVDQGRIGASNTDAGNVSAVHIGAGNTDADKLSADDVSAVPPREEQPTPGAVSLATVDLAVAGASGYRTGSGSIDLVTVLSGTVAAGLEALSDISLAAGDVLLTRGVTLRLTSTAAQIVVVSFVPTLDRSK